MNKYLGKMNQRRREEGSWTVNRNLYAATQITLTQKNRGPWRRMENSLSHNKVRKTTDASPEQTACYMWYLWVACQLMVSRGKRTLDTAGAMGSLWLKVSEGGPVQ